MTVHHRSFQAEPDLFNLAPLPEPTAPIPYPPHGAGFKGERGGPSELTAKDVAPKAPRLRGIVLAELRKAAAEGGASFQGLTAEEISDRLDLNPLSVKPRTSELFRLGEIEKGKTLGLSKMGSPATRWLPKADSAPLVPNGDSQ